MKPWWNTGAIGPCCVYSILSGTSSHCSLILNDCEAARKKGNIHRILQRLDGTTSLFLSKSITPLAWSQGRCANSICKVRTSSARVTQSLVDKGIHILSELGSKEGHFAIDSKASLLQNSQSSLYSRIQRLIWNYLQTAFLLSSDFYCLSLYTWLPRTIMHTCYCLLFWQHISGIKSIYI